MSSKQLKCRNERGVDFAISFLNFQVKNKMLISSKNTLKKTCLPNSHHTNNKTNEQIQMHIIKNNHSTSYNHFCWEDQFSSEFG
jgi:hypothetical protein